MTSFKNIFEETNRVKFKVILSTLGIETFVIALGLLLSHFKIQLFVTVSGGLDTVPYITFASFAFIAFLFKYQGQVWTQNRFRLIPVSNSKLVAVNFLGSYLITLFFIGCQTLLYKIAALLGGKNEPVIEMEGITGPQFAVILTVTVLVFSILGIVLETLIDLAGKSILRSLPTRIGKFLIIVLYIIITVIFIFILNLAISGLQDLFANFSNSQIGSSIVLGFSILVSIDIMWALVVWVFNRYIESKK